MWTDFVSEVTPSLAVSRLNFEKEVEKYLKSQPTLNALLCHLPAGMLVRVWVEGDARLHVRAIKPPKGSILFEIDEYHSISCNGEQMRTREEIDSTFFRPHESMALAFFFTRTNPDPLADKNTTIMRPLDFVKLGDMVNAASIVLDASFSLPPHRLHQLVR
jgi:hypothetical protein